MQKAVMCGGREALPGTGRIRAIARVVAVVVALALTGSCTSDPGVESAGLEEALAAAGSVADDRPAGLERLGTPDAVEGDINNWTAPSREV